jgi:hypothetical protein
MIVFFEKNELFGIDMNVLNVIGGKWELARDSGTGAETGGGAGLTVTESRAGRLKGDRYVEEYQIVSARAASE